MPNSMEPKQVLLIGAGYLGQRIAQTFEAAGYQVQVLDAPEIDITNLAALSEVLKKAAPSLVINAAAMTNTNQMELPEYWEAGYRVNVQGPANLGYLARQLGFRLVHISTGMMFDGRKADGSGWSEEDLPSPTNYYAWTKAWADWQLHPFMERDGILITRIHLPLSRLASPKNLLDKLRNFDKVVDTETSATVVEDYLNTLLALVERKATGLYNVVNPGTISFWQMMELLKKHGLVAADKPVQKLSKAEFDAMIATSGGAYQSNPILDTTKLQKAGIVLPDITEAVEAAIKAMK